MDNRTDEKFTMMTKRQPLHLKHPSAPARSSSASSALLPLALGCSFPLVATILDILGRGLPFSLESIIIVQQARPLHWLLDLMPLILWFFAATGRHTATQARIAALLNTVAERWLGNPPHKDKAALSVPASQNPGLLLTEDNPVNQKLVARLLHNLGYNVKVVETGYDAVEAFSQESYALVFMDCQMPGMNGFEATTQIRLTEKRLGGHTTIIALTAQVGEGDRERCLAAGMDDYLSKPINQKALQTMLAKWGCLPTLAPTLQPVHQKISA
jgi:CheY-like chemotaxis protein